MQKNPIKLVNLKLFCFKQQTNKTVLKRKFFDGKMNIFKVLTD